jgi:hypothetical protein
MITRRSLFIGSALALTARACTPPLAFAQDAPEVHIAPDVAKWFEDLKRPDIDPGAGVTSCCDFGDAYPCEILEEAEPHTLEWGRLRITDTTPRTLRIPTPTGAVREKFRSRITDDPPIYRYQGMKVTRERDGNPTSTAWVFAYVNDGKLDTIYCVVPLPPGI